MNRKWVEDSKEDVSDSESTTSSREEEPLDRDINEMAQQLTNSIPKEKALNLLHSMAASKDILYWNSHGEMTYHQRRIPVTSMKELIENALLSYNPDVRAPRGLKTFTNGLAELGINKHLISNEKLLVDLVAKQPDDEDTDNSETDSQSTDDETYDHVNDEDQEEEHSVDDEDERKDEEDEESMDEESDCDEQKQIECHVCQEPREFSKISIVRCPTCHWHEGHYSSPLNEVVRCDICTSVFPANLQNTRKMLCCCNYCDSIHKVSLKTGNLKLVVPQQGGEEMEEQATNGTEEYFPTLDNWKNY